MTRVGRCAFWLAAALLWPFAAQADVRVALVIGNSAYEHGRQLTNPVHDARRVAALLASMGYKLVGGGAQTDLSLNRFRDVEQQFATLQQGADVALVYYAGHGVEVGGRNYLIPIDANLQTEAAVRLFAVPLTEIVDAAQLAGRARIVIVDACRTNDFPLISENGGRGGGRGLVREGAPSRTLVAYSASENQIAQDGSGDNGPYALALVKYLATPNLDVRRLFAKVQDDVLRNPVAAGQEPMTEDKLGDIDLSLNPVAAPPPPKQVASIDPKTNAVRVPVKTYILFFDFASSEVVPSALPILQAQFEAATWNVCILTGHTDTAEGRTPAERKALSERRAQATADQLRKLHENASFAVIAGGSADPLVPTGPGVREPQNRRVVIQCGL